MGRSGVVFSLRREAMSKSEQQYELDCKLRLLLTGDDGRCGQDEARLRLAVSGRLSSYYGSAGGKDGLVVNTLNDTNTWNKSDVIPVENPGNPGIFTTLHIWRNRDKLSLNNRLNLERWVDSYRHPPRSYPLLELIETCRLKGAYVWFEPITSWGRAYEVCRRSDGMTLRHVCSADELEDMAKGVAIAALEELQ